VLIARVDPWSACHDRRVPKLQTSTPVDRVVHTPVGNLAALDYGGTGPDALLLHGGGRTAADWHLTAPHLTDSLHVVALDFRGHGQSEAVAGWTIDDGCADVACAIEAFGLDQPIVMGHSLGGMVAVRFAAGVGAGRVGAVVNVDGHGTGHPSQFDGIDAQEVGEFLTEAEQLSLAGFRELLPSGDRAWMDAQVADMVALVTQLDVPVEVAELLVRRAYRPIGADRFEPSPNVDVMVSMWESLRRLDMRPAYLDLACPTLVFQTEPETDEGPQEFERYLEAVHLGMGRQLRELAAVNPRIVITEMDCGHMVPLVRPRELAEIVLEFLKEWR
jgi:pimeloyl-ACP methyl ester carboxylesterase